MKRGEFEAALAHYDKALSLNAEATAARSNRALCHLKLGRFAEALADCEAVLEKEPRNVKALLRKAQACEELERTDEAQGAWLSVLEMEPGNAQARRALEAAGGGSTDKDGSATEPAAA